MVPVANPALPAVANTRGEYHAYAGSKQTAQRHQPVAPVTADEHQKARASWEVCGFLSTQSRREKRSLELAFVMPRNPLGAGAARLQDFDLQKYGGRPKNFRLFPPCADEQWITVMGDHSILAAGHELFLYPPVKHRCLALQSAKMPYGSSE